MNDDTLQQILSKQWFYEFHLPDGSSTTSYLPAEAQKVHSTRLDMMAGVLEPLFAGRWESVRAVDLACHEGYFATQLAAKGADVLGLEARKDHVDDANLIARGLQLQERFKARQVDVHDVMPEKYGRFEIVLMLGLIYHLENPVGAIRTAHSLTKEVCLIETQVAPNLSGQLDWGHYEFVKPMMGSFAIIDETEEVHGPEMSTTGICLAPSIEALMWIMRAVGFRDVQLVPVPEDGYEQHRHKKRVMVAGFV